ncbi:MAG: GumC family protein [Hyphomicrobiaceae bacterium]
MQDHIGLEQKPAFDLNNIILIVRRNARKLVLGLLLGLFLGAALLVLIQPTYQATTTLMVDGREQKVFGSDAVISPFRAESTAIASEVAVIKSPEVLRKVVEKLDLAHDPEFEVIKSPPGPLSRLKRSIQAMIGIKPPATGFDPTGDSRDETTELIENFYKAVTVGTIQYTNLIDISVSSKDPDKAARMANALADAYLLQQLETRYGATRKATDWLRARLDELKEKLRLSEQRLEKYKADMDLSDKESTTLDEQQLVRINEQLVNARAQTAEAEAKYLAVRDRAAGGALDDEKLAEFIRSDLITQLRSQLATVIRNEDSLNARYGTNHPAVMRVRAERKGLNGQIDAEVRRAVAVLKNEYEIAASREKALQASLKDMSEKTNAQKQMFVHMRELRREAESDKVLYEGLLQRVKQTAAQESWKATDFRVVAEAVPPRYPSQPKTKLLAFAGVGIGLVFGVGLTLLSEMLDRTFKRGRDVEAKLSLPHLGYIPALSQRALADPSIGRTPGERAFRYSMTKSGTPFADSILALHANLEATGRSGPIKSVMFTSARSGEGKSVIAANFAQVSARSGLKTLLICADLRTPTIRWFATDRRLTYDIADYLMGKVQIENVILRDEESTVDIVPATRTVPDSGTLLASARMKTLLAWARANYDMCVIDAVASVPCLDGRVIARQVDATVLVLEWHKTTLDTAREAVDLLVKSDAMLAGAVLNKVDFAKAKLYGLPYA